MQSSLGSLKFDISNNSCVGRVLPFFGPSKHFVEIAANSLRAPPVSQMRYFVDTFKVRICSTDQSLPQIVKAVLNMMCCEPRARLLCIRILRRVRAVDRLKVINSIVVCYDDGMLSE